MSDRLPSLPSSPELRASWQRSHRHGLSPDQQLPDDILSRANLAERLEANARLVAFSRPAIENLYQQIASPSSTVLLADNRGLILSALGNTDFLDRAARVALSPGAEWSEASVGTNAIGTALHTGRIVAVRGDEHYLDRNRFLTCVATPILAPRGGTMGILDVSTDARADISHAGALLRTTAELIEHRLIDHLDDGFMTLRFHTHHDMIGGPLEAVAVFDGDGRLLASNRCARTLLQLHPEYPDALYPNCFETGWSSVLSRAGQQPAILFQLHSRHGRRFFAQASLRARAAAARRHPAPAPEGPQSAAPATDRRVTQVVDAFDRAARTGDPLLLEGETGTGKTYLLRAFHQRHFGAGAPLTILDCSALADPDAAGQALDEALRQAAGGVLFLVEIDALDRALQARVFVRAAPPHTPQIVLATRSLVDELVPARRFDRDAFDACGGRVLSLPPLRSRTDFDELVRDFVRDTCAGRQVYVCPDAIALLRRHAWPGNLRELRNQLRLILALIGDDAHQLCPEDIPPELFEDAVSAPL